jgi:hypothetical protein
MLECRTEPLSYARERSRTAGVRRPNAADRLCGMRRRLID